MTRITNDVLVLVAVTLAACSDGTRIANPT